MRRPYLCAAAVAMAVGLAGSALGEDNHWTGGGGSAAWNDSHNWELGIPGPNTTNAWLQIPAANPLSTVVTIPLGYTANVGTAFLGQEGTTAYGTIFGPEWGMTLNIHGTLNYDWMLYPVGSVANPSFINMDGNAVLTGVNLGIGNSWWFHGGPNVTMTMTGNAAATVAWLFWGGHVNLYGGTFTINGGVNEDVLDAVSDATRLMDITGGKLVLGFGDQTALVNSWMSRGILQAYGGVGSILIDTLTMPGQTIVTAVIPEPSSMALLGFGALATLFSLRRRSASIR